MVAWGRAHGMVVDVPYRRPVDRRGRRRSARTRSSRRGPTSPATSTAARRRCPSADIDGWSGATRGWRSSSSTAATAGPRSTRFGRRVGGRRARPGHPRQRRPVRDRGRAARDPAVDGPPRLARRDRARDGRGARDRQHGARPRSRSGCSRRVARPTCASSMRRSARSGSTALEALANGDIPGISMILIDGVPVIGRSRNTAPAGRAAEVVKGPAVGGRRALMRFGLRLPSFALGRRARRASPTWAPTCGGPRTSASRARCSSTTCSSRPRRTGRRGSSRSRCWPRCPA